MDTRTSNEQSAEDGVCDCSWKDPDHRHGDSLIIQGPAIYSRGSPDSYGPTSLRELLSSGQLQPVLDN
jgi:hypothetical protein